MTFPAVPLPFDDDLPDPDGLQGIAQRLQAAIDEALVATANAAGPSGSAETSDDVESHSAGLAGEVIDRRLYFPDSEGWKLGVKSGPREYCSHRNPGEEWFHLLLDGELFLQFGEEKVCLNCAFRNGLLTDDRLFWQKGHRRQRIFPASKTEPGLGAETETLNDLPNHPRTSEDDSENPTERKA